MKSTIFTIILINVIVLSVTNANARSPIRNVCNSPSTSSSNVKLNAAINELSDAKFSTEQSRIANKTDYYSALKKVVLATSQGQALINCFENSTDPKVAPGFNFLVLAKTTGGLTASFSYEQNSTTKKYKPTIELKAAESPFAAVTFFAHELKHSCNGIEVFTDESSTDYAERDQGVLIDELKSYKLHVEFFHELAKEEPELFCETTGIKNSMYGRNMTLQELMAQIDEDIQAGSFYQKLIPFYMKAGTILLIDSFYNISTTDTVENECTSDEEDCEPVVSELVTTRTLRSDLIQRFRDEGFNYVQPRN